MEEGVEGVEELHYDLLVVALLHQELLQDDLVRTSSLACILYVDELDGADRVARRCAFREGHTPPLAKGAATTADRTIIGRVRM